MLTVDDAPVEPLAVASRSPFTGSFIGRTADRAFLVFRDLRIGRGLRAAYLAPEHLGSTEVTGAADVYAWGWGRGGVGAPGLQWALGLRDRQRAGDSERGWRTTLIVSSCLAWNCA